MSDNIEEIPGKNNKITNWKNEPSFDNLYSDYKEAMQDHGLLINKLDEWAENMDGGKPIKAEPGKSKVRPKLIRKQAEWKYPALEEPFLNTKDMFKVAPRTFEDTEAARQNQLVLNYQWTTKVNKVELVNAVVRGFYDEGTVIVKTGWEVEEDIIEVETDIPVYATPEQSLQIMQSLVSRGQMSQEEMAANMQAGKAIQIGTRKGTKEETILVKNQPTYEVCDIRNVIIDPTANGSIRDANFVIHKYETDLATLKRQKYTEIEHEDGTIEQVGIYKNLDKVEKELDDTIRPDEYYEEYERERSVVPRSGTNFKFKDKPRKKIEAYEYWGYWDIHGDGEVVQIIATWVNKTLIRLEESPFPFNELPFSIARYMPIKNEMYGEPDGELLIENQESIGKMMRAAHDITATHAVGQEFIDEQFFAGPLQKDNYKTGKTVYFRTKMDPRQAIYKKSVDPVPPAVFDMIQYHQNDAEAMSGTKSFSNGIGSQSLGSVATGIRSALDATSKRELSLLRRLADDIFKDIATKTIKMNQAFLSETEVVRITNSEFVTIKREDIQGDFDLTVEVSTPEKDNEKAEKLNMLMQTNAANMPPGLQKIIYAKIARLWKEPDLAEQVESYEPEPDPMQQQIAQLQLENAMLENQKLKMEIAKTAKLIESEDSKIEERESRTAQNLNSETEENKATARLKLAQAKKLEEEADAVRLDYVRKINGIDRDEKEEEIEASFLAKHEELKLKQQHDKELAMLKAEIEMAKLKIKELEADIKVSQHMNNIEAKEQSVAESMQHKTNLDTIKHIEDIKGHPNALI